MQAGVSDAIQISGRGLAAVLPGECPRCFWIQLHYDLPFQRGFPGIFSSIDSFTKKVVHHYFDAHRKLSEWFPDIGPVSDYVRDSGSLSSRRFRIYDERTKVTLTLAFPMTCSSCRTGPTTATGIPGAFVPFASSEYVAALEAFLIALAQLLIFIGTVEMVLFAVDIGLSIWQATGLGAIAAIAAQVAIMAALQAVGNQLFMVFGDIIAGVVGPALLVTSFGLALAAAFVAVAAALHPGAWTSSLVAIKVADFNVYGEVAEIINLKPVYATREVRRYQEESGSTTSALLAMIALFFASLSVAVALSEPDPLFGAAMAVVLDVIGIVFAAASIFDMQKVSPLTVFGRMTRPLALASLGVAIAAFGVDIVILEGQENRGG